MALTQVNKQLINEVLPIFQTTDGNSKKVLKSKGTFIIFIKDRKSEKPIIIFQGSYFNGQGFYNGEILSNYIVSVYPSGFFGVSSALNLGFTTNIVLTSTIIKSQQIRQNQINFINSKITNV